MRHGLVGGFIGLLAFVVVCGACKEEESADAPAEEQEAQEDPVVKEVQEWADGVCACDDLDCLGEAGKNLVKLGIEMGDKKVTAADLARVQGSIARAKKCIDEGRKTIVARGAGEGPDEATPSAEKMDSGPMVALDLTAAGLKATIQAPGNAVAKDSFGTVEVKVGDGSSFYIEIDKGAPDLAAIKKKWQENDVQKLRKVHGETKDVLIVETEFMGKTSFWLDMRIPFGEEMVHCRSGRGAPSFSQGQMNLFLVSCRSLKPITKVEVETIEHKGSGDLGTKKRRKGSLLYNSEESEIDDKGPASGTHLLIPAPERKDPKKRGKPDVPIEERDEDEETAEAPSEGTRRLTSVSSPRRDSKFKTESFIPVNAKHWRNSP